MKFFRFEVEIMGIFGAYKQRVWQRSNHLHGAIRQIYQNEPKLIRIVRILGEQ